MTDKPLLLLKDVATIKALANRLAECPAVTQHDIGEQNEAWGLAGGFSHLEEAFRTFLDEYLPKLVDQQVNGEALVDVLQDIGEEFRTILWHIQDTKFYQYLHDGSTAVDPMDRGKPKENPGRETRTKL